MVRVWAAAVAAVAAYLIAALVVSLRWRPDPPRWLHRRNWLFSAELFAALAELQALEYRQFMRELVNAGLPVMQLPILTEQLLLLLVDFRYYLRCHHAKLVRTQVGEAQDGIYAAQFARTG